MERFCLTDVLIMILGRCNRCQGDGVGDTNIGLIDIKSISSVGCDSQSVIAG